MLELDHMIWDEPKRNVIAFFHRQLRWRFPSDYKTLDDLVILVIAQLPLDYELDLGTCKLGFL